ncbi:MAG: hypothetical protein LBO77_02100 [Desulfovibrio sp.]|jgi:hypothetical protein|nr:hypothetical protein [Desulfovibrio sp.]
MIIDMENRLRLQRVLERRIVEIEAGDGRNFLLVMLSLLYDLEEMERMERERPDRGAVPAGTSREEPEENRMLEEENRRLKALLDVFLSRVRFAPEVVSETMQ